MARTTKAAASKAVEKKGAIVTLQPFELKEYELLEQYRDFTYIMVNGSLVPVHDGKVVLSNPGAVKGLLK
ncbi:hypothetical protein [Anaerovibrio sp.]|uniref:hypothetical protein n=1 Tax=Anaerovibrio sp. TaxID=1872532 RepID=UPI003F1655DD